MDNNLGFKENFEGRNDLKVEYGNNSLLLYVLQLKYNLDDIREIAEEYLVDGSNDHKCDLLFVDRENGVGIIAQSYFAEEWNKVAAPSNKASDLNTAVTWALSHDITRLSERVKSAALDLRNAINENEISSIELWYVHNCNESTNVNNELLAVVDNTNNIIESKYSDKNIRINAREIGLKSINDLYNEIQTPILVNDTFTIRVSNGYEIDVDNWKAYSTAVDASWIYSIFHKYDKNLFSANIRDYLGSRKSDTNINNNIKNTAENDPVNFWVYNNGITALVNDYTINRHSNYSDIIIKGISIVNGAQTTGAIGSLPEQPNDAAKVSIRFIKSNYQEVIKNIVQYNNSQNKLMPADYRSNDPIQKRLREDFDIIPNFDYLGGRRGGRDDFIRRNSDVMPSDTVAQALTAFHGDPVTAYNSKKKVWNNNENYSLIFNDNTTAHHIIFVYSLFKAIVKYKHGLREKQNNEGLTEIDEGIFDYLRFRGSIPLYTYSIGYSIETLLGGKIASKYKLEFLENTNLDNCIEKWIPILDSTSGFCNKLLPAIENGLNNAVKVEQCVRDFNSMIHATKRANESIFDNFSSELTQIS